MLPSKVKLRFLNLLDRVAQRGGRSDSVFRNMLILASGSAAARMIGVFAAPLIVRIYTPADFGLLAIYMSLVAIMTPLGTLRLALAIPLPRTERLAVHVAVISLALLFIFGLLQSIALWYLGPLLLSTLSAQALIPYWWVLVVGTFGAGLYEVITMWGTRKKLFTLLARSQFSQAVVGLTIKLLLGIAGVKPVGLLIGQIFQQSAGIYFLSRRFFADVGRHLNHIRLDALLAALSIYKGFPTYRLPAQFLFSLSMQCPVLLSAAIFSSDEVGNLSLALAMTALPISVLGASTGQAFYAEISRMGRKRSTDLYALCKATAVRLAVVSLLPTLVILLLSPFLFPLIFGEAWRQSGEIASFMAIYLLPQFVSSPLSSVLNIYDKMHFSLILNATRLVSVTLIFAIAYEFRFSFISTIFIYSSFMFFYYSLYIFVILTTVQKGIRA